MPIRQVLRADLAEATKARDLEAVSMVRILIAAIENAEAVDASESEGISEVARRHLSEDDILDIILNESKELRHAADEFERLGNRVEAQRLRSLAGIADRYAKTLEAKRP